MPPFSVSTEYQLHTTQGPARSGLCLALSSVRCHWPWDRRVTAPHILPALVQKGHFRHGIARENPSRAGGENGTVSGAPSSRQSILVLRALAGLPGAHPAHSGSAEELTTTCFPSRESESRAGGEPRPLQKQAASCIFKFKHEDLVQGVTGFHTVPPEPRGKARRKVAWPRAHGKQRPKAHPRAAPAQPPGTAPGREAALPGSSGSLKAPSRS